MKKKTSGRLAALWRSLEQFSHAKIEIFGAKDSLARAQRFALFCGETIRAIIRHQTFTLASALAFKTLLSTVPLLMIGVAVSMMLGTENGISYADAFINAVEERIPQTPALKPLLELLRSIASRPREIAGLGFIMLFYTAYSLLASVEWCFNYIWQVEDRRPLTNRLSAYFIIIIVAPLLMSLSVYANSQITGLVNTVSEHLGDWGYSLLRRPPITHSALETLLHRPMLILFGALLTCTTLTILIKLMPFTKVHWRPAIWGGLGGGIFIELTRYCFGLYTAHATVSLSRLYGSTLLFIPLTLLWIWMLWALVLLGAEIAFGAQNYHDLALRAKINKGGLHYRLYLTLRILFLTGNYFIRGEKSKTLIDEATEQLKTAPFVVRSLIGELVALGLLRELAESPDCFVPGKDLNTLTLMEVITTIQRDQLVTLPQPDDKIHKDLTARFNRITTTMHNELGKISVYEFITHTETPAVKTK